MENNEEKKPDFIFSKSLEVKDYEELRMEVAHILETDKMLEGVPHFHQHEHRKWEYAIAERAILDNTDPHGPGAPVIILDVGGAGSTLGAALAMLGYHVHEIDQDDHGDAVDAQRAALEAKLKFDNNLTFSRTDFASLPLEPNMADIVTCISVIEHVKDDRSFVRKLGAHVKPGGLLILTTDFHPSGAPQTPWHERAYNKEGMLDLYRELSGFEMLNNQFSYDAYEQVVHGWSFASLIMRKL